MAAVVDGMRRVTSVVSVQFHSCLQSYFEGPTLENRGCLAVQSAIHSSGGELSEVMVVVRSDVVK
jgi:hypothetical protein